jgi:hypothetical protein
MFTVKGQRVKDEGVCSRDSDGSLRPNPWAYVPRDASHYLATFAAKVAAGTVDSIRA